MTRDGPNAKLKLLLSPDATEAELVVPADMAEDDVNADAVVALLFEAGVTVSDAIRDRLTKVIEAWSPGVESRDVIVEGRPAKHGRNGRVEWDEAVLSEAERDK